MGSMESLDDGSLRQMTLGSSLNPQPAELLVLRLQSKGAEAAGEGARVSVDTLLVP